jgi:signal transduction histidine kinase
MVLETSLRVPRPDRLSLNGSNYPHSFRTFVPIIVIAVVAIGLALLSYQHSILTSERIAIGATQDLKDNGRIQAYDISKSLENRLESIRSNLEILANAPVIQNGEDSQARILINTAEHTTRGFTDSYFWINETGKLQWAGAFVNETVYNQYYGADRTDRPYFTEPRDTHLPYISTLRDSVDGVPRIYAAYPIIANNDTGGGTFKGVLVASMNLVTLGNSINEQLPPDTQGSVSLMDRDGTVLYTQNEALLGKNYFSDELQTLLFTNYIPPNQKDTLNTIIRDSIVGNSGTAEYSLSGTPLILAYNPVMFDQGNGEIQQQHAMVLYLTLPKAFASDITLLIEQQRNLSTLVPAAIGVVAVVIALMIMRWNSQLEHTVKERTVKLEAANEQLEVKERTQREFINIAAHELRTPIQPILGLSEIIRERILNLSKQLHSLRGDDGIIYKQQDAASTMKTQSEPVYGSPALLLSNDEILEMADVINRNAKRLEKLTNTLLDVSRIENNKSLELVKERFDLGQKIENIINDMQSTLLGDKDIHIRFESKVRKDSVVMIEADKERILQVISNLLDNAIKFTEEGEVVVVLDQKDDQAIVSVRDTGSGIAPEIQPALFTKFTTRSEKGTGLGLFISKSIVEAHGGKIWANNNMDGMGATFTFAVPTITGELTDIPNGER